MVTTLRWIMGITAASLLIAAALHAGIVIPGRFDQAAIYESSIAVILIVGIGLTFIGPGWARRGALGTQALALAGSFVGLYLALRGIGPNTVPDIVYHFALIGMILIGLTVAWRLDGSRRLTDAGGPNRPA